MKPPALPTGEAADNRRTLVGISDGNSNTILAGHGTIPQGQYSLSSVGTTAGTTVLATVSNTVNIGGTTGTCRGGGAFTAGGGTPGCGGLRP